MRTELVSQPIHEADADALVLAAFDKHDPRDSGLLKAANDLTGGWIEELYSCGEFAGKLLDTALLHRPAGFKARRLLLIGCGKRDKFGAAELRKAAGAALRFLKARSARSIALGLDAELHAAEFVSAAAEGAILGDYEPDRFKTDKKDRKQVDRFLVLAPAEFAPPLASAVIVAESQNFARDLVAEPANRLTPTLLAERARAVAAEFFLDCEILDQDRLRQLGMGALLGVAQGSAEPPALILLRYTPAAAAASADHLALIGKGVTFDTGGISIKPSENMDKMKYDMAGGAAVIGAMRALAQLKPAIPVTALIPAVENMPGSRAQRPGDIVTSLSGKTIEVLNTDAEGRLILADAITYARRNGCTHLVDAATLTGAIVIALGHVHAGAFFNNDALGDRLLQAARNAGEKMWAMPLDDDYKEQLKSPFADIPNIGNRWGGAITAALFLKEFVEDTPWVHLDIAGTAWLEDAKPFLAKGPTGLPLRTLVRLVMDWT